MSLVILIRACSFYLELPRYAHNCYVVLTECTHTVYSQIYTHKYAHKIYIHKIYTQNIQTHPYTHLSPSPPTHNTSPSPHPHNTGASLDALREWIRNADILAEQSLLEMLDKAPPPPAQLTTTGRCA